ncbi:type II toxin-antitoxin system VapC family toxin [soil metagenome]
MYLLDTNVLSDGLKRRYPDLEAWLESQNAEDLFISNISLAEIAYGVHRLPDGKRNSELLTDLHLVRRRFGGRTLAVGAEVALAYGEHQAAQVGKGRNDDPFASLLLVTAKTNDLIVATRNVSHYEDRGVGVVNPYQP